MVNAKTQKNIVSSKAVKGNNIYTFFYMLWIFFCGFAPVETGIPLKYVVVPLVGLLLFSIPQKTAKRNKGFLLFFTVVFLAVVIFSTLKSDIVSTNASFRSTIIFVLSFMVLLLKPPTIFQMKRIKTFYIMCVSICTIYTIVTAMRNGFELDRYNFSFFWWTKDVNYFQAFILPGGYFAIRRYLFEKAKPIYLWVFISVVICVFLLQSRAAFLTLCISIVMLLIEYIFNSKLTNRRLLVILFAIIFAIVFCVLLYVNPVFSRLIDSKGYSNDIRFKVWEAAFKAFERNKWIGSGLGSASFFSLKYMNLYSHNNFLEILGCFGIIGFGTFILMLISISLVTKKQLLHFLSLMIVFLFPLSFINGFETSTFWMPMIFLAHQSSLMKKSWLYCSTIWGIKELWKILLKK